ncbi:MAG: hypothetical protein J6Z43_06575 [Clostridiales bacterium]|nr:hypothetical protein [Clostridiales bacterium]
MNSIANALSGFLNKEGWTCTYDKDSRSFGFDIFARGIIKVVHFNIVIGDADYTVMVSPKLVADASDEDMKTSLEAFFEMIKGGYGDGDFFIDDGGNVVYKMVVDCSSSELTDDVMRRSIYSPILTFERYGAGISAIILTNKSADSAYEDCKKLSNTFLHFDNLDGDDIRLFNSIVRLLQKKTDMYPE